MTMLDLPRYTADFEDFGHPYNLTANQPIKIGAASEGIEEPIPDELKEIDVDTSSLTPVYTAVSNRNLASIATQGLLRRKNAIGSYMPVCFEVAFLNELPEDMAQFDRTRVFYARPQTPADSIYTFTGEYNRGLFNFLELLVESEEVIVTDQWVVDSAVDVYRQLEDQISRVELPGRIAPYAKRYWSHSVSLAQHLLNPDSVKLDSPEVLIPFDIPPERIRALSS